MDSVFSDQQLSSIILWLKKWDIPVKYSYITKSWSNARSKLESLRTSESQSFYDSFLLEKTVDLYLQELQNPKKIAIFDFGCGTGETVKKTLIKLNDLSIDVDYHAFDISENIVNFCKNNISKLCNFDFTIVDFEVQNLVTLLYNIRSKYWNIPVLGLLLWNTVWNFSSMERVLSNIFEAFRLEDKLVVGIERVDLQNKRLFSKMMDVYNSKDVSNVFLWTIDELGFPLLKWFYEAIFNERTNAVEWWFVIKEDFEIKIKDTILSFSTKERIRIWQSKKLDESSLSKIFLDLDLRIANIRTDSNNSYLQVLVSPKKY